MSRPDHRRALGAAGEQAAARWYTARGYRVLDRNWRCARGELDLVLAGDGLVVFCEVKTRTSAAFGAPVEAVTARKAQRIRALASAWLAEHDVHGAVRFDVAAVTREPSGELAVEVLSGVF